jgi:hypothetical protein
LCGLTIDGPAAICDDGTFTAPAITGATYTWSVVSGGAFVNLAPNSNTLNITRRRQGNVNITIRVQITAGGCIATVDRTFLLGVPATTIIGPYDITQHTVMGVAYAGSTYYFLAGESSPHFPPIGTYTWTLFPPTGNPTLYAGSQPYISFTETGLHTLQVAKNTACGTITTSILLEVQENISGFRMMAAPNPTNSNNITVSIEEESSQLQNLPPDGDMIVELFHFNSATKQKEWKVKNHQKKFSLNLHGVAKGNYLLRVTRGNQQQTRQIIIN